MSDDFSEPTAAVSSGVAVLLDGRHIRVPAERRSLNAIRSYLETVAMEQHRILCALYVDGEPANSSTTAMEKNSFNRVEAETIDLAEMPLQLLETAMHQATDAQDSVSDAVTLVLINEADEARELWWNLGSKLRQPLLTLSLLPETLCGPLRGGASLGQLRRWQLEQLAEIIKDVDSYCSSDTTQLSNALESRVLPWIEKLNDLIKLWRQTVAAGIRLNNLK